METKESTESEKMEIENSRMEAALQKRKQLTEESEALKVREIMGGRSVSVPPVPKKVISPQEYANAALKGIILKE